MSRGSCHRTKDIDNRKNDQTKKQSYDTAVSARATVERHDSQHLIGQSRIDIQLSYTKDYHQSIKSFHRYRTRMNVYFVVWNESRTRKEWTKETHREKLCSNSICILTIVHNDIRKKEGLRTKKETRQQNVNGRRYSFRTIQSTVNEDKLEYCQVDAYWWYRR